MSRCLYVVMNLVVVLFFFFQAEDGIRDLVRSRGLGDVYKRQGNKAVEKGLITSEALAKMTDRDVQFLIFAPGFSLSLIHI